MQLSESTVRGGIAKNVRYDWKISDEPGRLLTVSKHELFVDEAYQRGAQDDKILAIARDWSWIACGAIIVALREGRMYVVDGQHRLLAARRRDDIKTLPCLVFETQGQREEARGFLRANTLRKPMSSYDKFRALVVTQDPIAIETEALIEKIGRAPGTWSGPLTVQCLSTLMRELKTNRDALLRVWPVVARACHGHAIDQKLLMGLVYIEGRLPDGVSLSDRRWADRLANIGAPALLEAANRASAYYARGGANIWASGILTAINKGLRTDLVVRGMKQEEG